MGSSSGPSPANAFLAHLEQNCLGCCSLEYRPLYCWWCVDDIFVLFKGFLSYSNSCHVNIRLTIETEQNKKISQGKFVTSFYRNQLLVVYIPILIAFYLIPIKLVCYTLVNRCFWICSKWSMFRLELTLLRDISEKWQSRNLHDRCFKLFLNRIHIL